MHQAAAGSVGQRCQLEGDISIQNKDLGKQVVTDPVNGTQRCQVRGELVINMENLGNECVEGNLKEERDLEQEEYDVYEYHLENYREKVERDYDLEIYRAAVKGDWKAATEKYQMDGKDFDAPIATDGKTALHIAALAEQFDFVRQWVNKLSGDGVKRLDVYGNTALYYAVGTGKKELARVIFNKDQGLPTMRNSMGTSPLNLAALLGHKEMAFDMYKFTMDLLTPNELMDLFIALIDGNLYDIASQLLEKEQKLLSTGKDRNGDTALHALARKSHFSSNTSPQAQSRGLDITCSRNPRSCAHEILECICRQLLEKTDREIYKLIGNDWEPIFVAAKQGNVDFLRIVIRNFPQVVCKTNHDGLTIFHVAVINRREQIFSLIHEIGSFKNIIALNRDKNGNNMLHWAGTLAPAEELNVLPGEALQLRHELLWFKEVEKVVGPRIANHKNKKKQTPTEVFKMNHEKLAEAGAQSMRDTANSCIVVAALVATVAFAAAFTVPGGNDPNKGFPMFLHKTLFKVFVVSDAISLVFSVSSVLTFLSLFTSSTYTLNDFLLTIPAKLKLGLSTLFISIIAMMVSFVTLFFMYFEQEPLMYALPVAMVASVPICLFFGFHFRLFVDIVKSNYPIFHRNYKLPLFSTAEIKPKKKTS